MSDDIWLHRSGVYTPFVKRGKAIWRPVLRRHGQPHVERPSAPKGDALSSRRFVCKAAATTDPFGRAGTGRHPLFSTLKGEPLWDSYVRTLCKRLAAKAGIEKRVHPHGLRHGWALAQVQNGTSLNAIQQLLGHRSLHTTSVYLQHIAPAAAVAEAAVKTTHLAVEP